MSPRRYSRAPLIFVLLWALWLLIPSTREAALSQWKERFVTFSSEPDPADSSRDAGFVRALNASIKNRQSKAPEELGQRFPNDAAICAMQIIRSSLELHLRDTRQPGPSSSGEPNWSVKLAKIEKSPPAFLKSWFAATQRGMKLEPNNTFWDWSLVMGLLAARRDDKVGSVLQAARSKTDYNDHERDSVLAQVNYLKRQRGLVTPISQISIAAAALSPHFAGMREATRQIIDNASGARLSGDPQKQQQALQELADVLHLGRVLRRESKSSIGSLVGQAIEGIVLWSGSTGIRSGARVRSGAPLSAYTSQPSSLFHFARAMGRNDIATQVAHEWVEKGIWDRKNISTAIVANYSLEVLAGIEDRDFVLAQLGEWPGILLLGGVPTLLAVAVGCSILLSVVSAWRQEKNLQLSSLTWGVGAIFSITAVLVLSAPSLCLVVRAQQQMGWTLINVLIAPFYFFLEQDSNTIVLGGPRAWQWHFAALLGFVVASWCAVSWEARWQGNATLDSRLRRIFRRPDDGIVRFDFSSLLALIVTATIGFFVAGGILGYLVLPVLNEQYASWYDYAGFALILFAAYLSFPALGTLRTAPGRAFALNLARRFAWAQLIFVTVAWGLLWLFAMPAQHRFDSQFVRQQQIGRFQLVRQQLGL
ncbi:hypothetical protein IAD21_02072 [Abditibacteriota bacterium]|nr:hypothetical protein IAD21_02072 [Abditibacteriota bacterium]